MAKEVTDKPISAPLALALRSKNWSTVPPASFAAGVAQDARCAVVGRSWPVATRRLPPFAPSLARAVGQLASRATSLRGRALSPCLLLADDFQSLAVAVGQEASATALCSVNCALAPLGRLMSGGGSTVPWWFASGVGHAASVGFVGPR